MHSFRPVRAIYCPICAFECRQQMRHEVVCPNCLFSPQLQGALRAAVYGVDPPSRPPRDQGLGAWLWCPSCTAELDDYDEVGRFLRCPACALHLRSVSLTELIEAKAQYRDRNPADDWRL